MIPPEMKPRERILAALKRKPVDRIPYCELAIDPLVASQVASPEQEAAADRRIAERLGDRGITSLRGAVEKWTTAPSLRLKSVLDTELPTILGSDDVIYWGGFAPFTKGLYLLNPDTPELGYSSDGILKSRDDLAKMEFRSIDEIVADAKEFLAYKGDLAACAIICMGIDPAWHSMGFSTFCESCLLDPGLVEAVIGPISEWYAQVAEEFCKLDFDFIWGADDIAYHSAPFFSPDVYRRLLLPHTRKVAEKITKPWIFHSDGNLLPLWEDLTSQGMDAIHPLEAGSMDVRMLKEKYGHDIAFVGGVDLRVLEVGSPEETRRITRECISILGPDYGYLLATSNSVTPNVKVENLRAMLETLREYGQYPLKKGDSGDD